MNFKSTVRANNLDYEIVVPVPITDSDCFISIIRKDSQEEMLRINAQHLGELPDLAEKTAKLFPCQTLDEFINKYAKQ